MAKGPENPQNAKILEEEEEEGEEEEEEEEEEEGEEEEDTQECRGFLEREDNRQYNSKRQEKKTRKCSVELPEDDGDGVWEAAGKHFQTSLKLLPCNASALLFQGLLLIALAMDITGAPSHLPLCRGGWVYR